MNGLSSQALAGADPPNVDVLAHLPQRALYSRIRTSGAARTTAGPSRRNLSRFTCRWCASISFSTAVASTVDCYAPSQAEQGGKQTRKEDFFAQTRNV